MKDSDLIEMEREDNPHDPVSLGNAVCERDVPCASDGCSVSALAICWLCEIFVCFEHALDHANQFSQRGSCDH